MTTKKLSTCYLMEKSRISCGKDNNNSRTDIATVMLSIRRMLILRLAKRHLQPHNNSNNFLTKEDNKWIKITTSSKSIAITAVVIIQGLIIRTSRIATQRAKTNQYPSMSDLETVICHQASKISVTHVILRVSCRHSFTFRIFKKRSLHSTSRHSSRISKTWK